MAAVNGDLRCIRRLLDSGKVHVDCSDRVSFPSLFFVHFLFSLSFGLPPFVQISILNNFLFSTRNTRSQGTLNKTIISVESGIIQSTDCPTYYSISRVRNLTQNFFNLINK